jgi:hypothetical protein
LRPSYCYTFSFYHKCAVLEKISGNWSLLFGALGPALRGSSPEIYNLCAPCPKDASNQILKALEYYGIVIKRLKIFY